MLPWPVETNINSRVKSVVLIMTYFFSMNYRNLKKNVPKVLRQPIENPQVTISRASMTLTFPACFKSFPSCTWEHTNKIYCMDSRFHPPGGGQLLSFPSRLAGGIQRGKLQQVTSATRRGENLKNGFQIFAGWRILE